MRYVARRDESGEVVVVRGVRNNYRVKPGEAEVRGHVAVRLGSVAFIGDEAYVAPGHPLHRHLDEITPDTNDDVRRLKAEARLLHKKVEAAIRETATLLKRAGVNHPNAAAVIKYELLRLMDRPRKVRELAHIREGVRP